MIYTSVKSTLSADAVASAEEEVREETDEALVMKIQQGDMPSAEALIRRYRQKAFSIACTLCDGDRDAALDHSQEAFVKVLGNIQSFQGKSSFYTWFYRILVNTCLDGRRKRRRWQKLFPVRRPGSREEGLPEPTVEDFPADESGDPFIAVRGGNLARDLEKALSGLPEKQRTVFQLKVFHGMAISEIAAVTGAAQGTVKTHLFRATRALRAALSEWGGEDGVER